MFRVVVGVAWGLSLVVGLGWALVGGLGGLSVVGFFVYMAV